MGFPPNSPSGSSFVLPCLRKLRSFDVHSPSKGMLLGTPPFSSGSGEFCAVLCIFKRTAICRCWCSPSCTIAFPQTRWGAYIRQTAQFFWHVICASSNHNFESTIVMSAEDRTTPVPFLSVSQTLLPCDSWHLSSRNWILSVQSVSKPCFLGSISGRIPFHWLTVLHRLTIYHTTQDLESVDTFKFNLLGRFRRPHEPKP